MKCEKKISVIVPVYNVEKYLPQCLDSLVGQTYKNLEIILVDDGSVDQSGSICEKYARNSDKIFVYHKENGGVSSARNMGIEKSTGDYLVFVDADDIVHTELLEIYVRASELEGVPVCGVAREKEELKKSYVATWNSRMKIEQAEQFMEFLYEDYVNPPWNKLYDAEIIRRNHIRFDEEKNLGEDFLFNLEYFSYEKFQYTVIQYPLYYYREGRAESLGNTFKPQLFQLQIEMFNALYEFLHKKNVWNDENREKYYQLYWDRLYLTIRIYKKYGEKQQMRNCLKDAVWEEIEKNYAGRGIRLWKHLLKKVYLKILREYL